jgi:fucose permease
MTSRAEVGAVYGAGLLQGVALVTFPAASGIFTDPAFYGFTSAAYGGLFLPQAIMAVLAALSGAALARRISTKSILLAGLIADTASMALLLGSQASEGKPAAYPVLLVATALLGVGFGLTVPAVNTLAAAFFPAAVDRAVLILNALLGLGTTLAPALVALFVAAGAWWGLPLLTCVLLVALTVISSGLPLRSSSSMASSAPTSSGGGVPGRFWVFAAAALLYGTVETMNGNWAMLDMTANVGASAAVASLALTAFWGMVTVGRLLFAGLQRWLPEPLVYRVLPFVIAIAFVLVSRLGQGDGAAGVAGFALAGLGCSAMLPLTISFGQRELVTMGASVAAGLIAAYQIGYGIAAYGVGPLESALGVGLGTLYLWAAAVALLLAAASFAVVHRPRSVTAAPAPGSTT